MIHEYEAMGNLDLMVIFEKFKCNFIKGLAPVHCVVYRLALLYKTQHTDGGERTVFLCVKQSINNVVSKKLNGFSASSAQLASKLSVSLRYTESSANVFFILAKTKKEICVL